MKVYDRFLEARAKGQGLNFHADGAFGEKKPGKFVWRKLVETLRIQICPKISGFPL